MKRMVNTDINALKTMKMHRTCDKSLVHHEYIQTIVDTIRDNKGVPGKVMHYLRNGQANHYMLAAVEVTRHPELRLPPDMSLWIVGNNSLEPWKCNYIYGGIRYQDKFIPLERLSVRKMWNKHPEEMLRTKVEEMLFKSGRFSSQMYDLRHIKLNGEEQDKVLIRAAKKKLISFGRLSTLLGNKESMTAWRLALEFYAAIDRGQMIVTHRRKDRWSQMFAFVDMLMEEKVTLV